MKQYYFLFNYLKKTSLCFLMLFSGYFSFSQNMIFQNPSLVSGTAGNDGAVYKFANVTTGIDALVAINKRSSSLVTLDSIDMISTGYLKAFQPMISYNNSSVSGQVSWWMEFNISFVNAGTNTVSVQDSLYASALDIDGDNGSLQEQFTALGSGTYTMNSPSNLTPAIVSDTIGAAGNAGTITSGVRFTGTTINYPGIDTTVKSLLVTVNYKSVSSITIRYGGQTTGSGSAVSVSRMNSLWFQDFNYLSPVSSTLPIELESFTAQLTGNNKVMLNWGTSTGINFSHFEVERSLDGKSFDEEGIVFAADNSTVAHAYSFKDNINFINQGLIYYRLKMVDIDGGHKYSDFVIVRLTNAQSQVNVVIYPNPAVSELRVTIPDSWQNKTVAYNIYNLTGNLVKSKTISNPGQTETFDVSGIPVGSYIIKTTEGSEMTVNKFIKAH